MPPQAVHIDGVDVTRYALSGSVKRRLNRPAEGTITLPMWDAIGGAGSRIKIAFDGQLAIHGFCQTCETDTAEDGGRTVYNVQDVMELWAWRPCRDYDGLTPGNFVDPYFMFDHISGPQIIESILRASENPALIDTVDGSFAEGPLYINYGDFEPGGLNLTGAPTNWPMSIMELVTLLTSTGEVDVILTPIDSGGNMALVSCYNGDYGTDRTGSVVLEYGMGSHNARALRWNEDMTNTCNKLQYFFTPKETIRRYKANITGDDPCLDDPPQADIQALREASRAAVGVRMEIQTFDVDKLHIEDHGLLGGECNPPLDATRTLYRRLWQLESWMRAQTREMIHITPVAGSQINAFGIGDLITVQAGAQVRGGFSGFQRVYEYTVGWEPDGPLELTEIVASPNQEGI